MTPQQQYQADLLKSLGHQTNTPLYESWWYNPLNGKSMRLTKMGLVWCSDVARIPSYQIELDRPLTSKHLLQLERLLVDPYFIQKINKLLLFSERDAIMLRLNNGDLTTYLNSLEQH
jgi:hypothetical protein